MQALHQENVSFCSLRRYFTQLNKWDAVYIGPQFGLKINGGGGGGLGWWRTPESLPWIFHCSGFLLWTGFPTMYNDFVGNKNMCMNA